MSFLRMLEKPVLRTPRVVVGKHKDQVLQGAHEAIVSQELFDTVQMTLLPRKQESS